MKVEEKKEKIMERMSEAIKKKKISSIAEIAILEAQTRQLVEEEAIKKKFLDGIGALPPEGLMSAIALLQRIQNMVKEGKTENDPDVINTVLELDRLLCKKGD